MRKYMVIAMALFPCTALATTDCRIFEFPDHYEVDCGEGAVQTTGPVTTENGPNPSQEQTVVSAQPPDSELPDVAPENIVRNELARLHGASWLKSKAGQ